MSRSIRLLFLGTSEFAVPILAAICSDPAVSVEGIVTRPDRPAGRGRRLRQTPVTAWASTRDLPLLQPEKLRGEFRETVSGINPDVIVSAAYGAYLPGWLLDSAPLGVVNIHPSLLPLYRGAAPVTRAILSGETRTGITFMVSDSGWDTGPLLCSFSEEIRSSDTTGSLENRLSALASSRVVGILKEYASGLLSPLPQEGEPSCADKVSPDETWLDWSSTATELERRVRAFQPVPGARTLFRGRILKIHAAAVSRIVKESGRIYLSPDGGMIIGCGEGSLGLLSIQPEAGRIMDVDAFVRGYKPEENEECRKA
jgi:methionyl-tRNA formyltransferase